MERSTFADRFGYARWLAHLRTGKSPSFADIGQEIGRTGPAVGAWTDAIEPPPDYRIHGPLARYFDLPEMWLIRNEGDPPRPELWKEWMAARAADIPQLTLSSADDDSEPELAPTKTGVRRRRPKKKAVHPLDAHKNAGKRKPGR